MYLTTHYRLKALTFIFRISPRLFPISPAKLCRRNATSGAGGITGRFPDRCPNACVILIMMGHHNHRSQHAVTYPGLLDSYLSSFRLNGLNCSRLKLRSFTVNARWEWAQPIPVLVYRSDDSDTLGMDRDRFRTNPTGLDKRLRELNPRSPLAAKSRDILKRVHHASMASSGLPLVSGTAANTKTAPAKQIAP